MADENKGIAELRDRITDLEHRLIEELVKTDMRINQLEENINLAHEHIADISPSSDGDLSGFEQRLSDLEHLITSMEVSLVKSGEHPHVSNNKSAEDKLKSVEENLVVLLKRVNAIETDQLHKPITESVLGSKINSNEKPDIDENISYLDGVRKELLRLKNDMDTTKIKDRNVDAELVNIEEKVNKYLQDIKHDTDKKLIDIEEKLDAAFQHVPGKDYYEKNIELKIINMLSEKIENFSNMMDRKLLEFETKEETTRKLARLEGLVAKLESPNMRPLEQRLHSLEVKLDDLINNLDKHLKRIPMVVH